MLSQQSFVQDEVCHLQEAVEELVDEAAQGPAIAALTASYETKQERQQYYKHQLQMVSVLQSLLPCVHELQLDIAFS